MFLTQRFIQAGLGLSSAALWCASQEAAAIAVQTPAPASSLGFGLSSLYRQQPDLLREQRYRFDVFWFERLGSCGRLCLHWENHLGLGPDLTQRSKAVEVKDNVYHAFTGLKVSYSYLLRYGLSLGPLIDWHETHTKLKIGQQEHEVFRRWAWGWWVAPSISYALTPRWEILLFSSYQARPIERKADMSFGVSMMLGSSPPLQPLPQGPAAATPVAPAPNPPLLKLPARP